MFRVPLLIGVSSSVWAWPVIEKSKGCGSGFFCRSSGWWMKAVNEIRIFPQFKSGIGSARSLTLQRLAFCEIGLLYLNSEIGLVHCFGIPLFVR